MGWQWHQQDHMQIIRTSLQTDNHVSTLPLSCYSWVHFLPPIQQCKSTEVKLYDPKNHKGTLQGGSAKVRPTYIFAGNIIVVIFECIGKIQWFWQMW